LLSGQLQAAHRAIIKPINPPPNSLYGLAAERLPKGPMFVTWRINPNHDGSRERHPQRHRSRWVERAAAVDDHQHAVIPTDRCGR
jgi:hypothetical protein